MHASEDHDLPYLDLFLTKSRSYDRAEEELIEKGKAGPGSRGGKIMGYAPSGKALYVKSPQLPEGHPMHTPYADAHSAMGTRHEKMAEKHEKAAKEAGVFRPHDEAHHNLKAATHRAKAAYHEARRYYHASLD